MRVLGERDRAPAEGESDRKRCNSASQGGVGPPGRQRRAFPSRSMPSNISSAAVDGGAEGAKARDTTTPHRASEVLLRNDVARMARMSALVQYDSSNGANSGVRSRDSIAVGLHKTSPHRQLETGVLTMTPTGAANR